MRSKAAICLQLQVCEIIWFRTPYKYRKKRENSFFRLFEETRHKSVIMKYML